MTPFAFCVQFMTSQGWQTIAAFDHQWAALDYADICRKRASYNRHPLYRVIPLEEETDDVQGE